MRIVAGRFKGRRLAGPRAPGVRPTSDRLRETVFNVLGPSIEGLRVLDAFAGTGALGLEALSRGAAHVTFVERDHDAVAVVKANVAACAAEDECTVCRAEFRPPESRRGRRGWQRERYDLVLLDPPYDVEDLAAVLKVAEGVLQPGGRVILEHSRRRQSPESVIGLARVRVLQSGDSAVSSYVMTEPPRLAIVPGSFDPFTLGHADVVARAAALFDQVIVAILVNPDKRPMFSVPDRLAIIRETTASLPNVEVDSFEGLLVDYAARRNASAIVRGLRSVTDFDYEMQMALMNRHLRDTVDTVFLAPSERYAYVSSGLVREIISLGGSLDGLVPGSVVKRVEQRRRQATTRQA